MLDNDISLLFVIDFWPRMGFRGSYIRHCSPKELQIREELATNRPKQRETLHIQGGLVILDIALSLQINLPFILV